MSQPRLLDAFCKAGGATRGYQLAGFHVTGVDIDPQPRYVGDEFIQADAMDVLADTAFLDTFDVRHASPPCPRYSSLTVMHDRSRYPDLVAPVRDLLRAHGGPYVIENVPGAPLDHPVLLCGGAFGLGAVCRDGEWRALRRHRLFESNMPLMSAGCACSSREPVGIYGHGGVGAKRLAGSRRGYQAIRAEGAEALGIGWMSQEELANAIPPAMTEFIGSQLLDHLAAEREASPTDRRSRRDPASAASGMARTRATAPAWRRAFSLGAAPGFHVPALAPARRAGHLT